MKSWLIAATVAVSLSACADGPPKVVKSPDSVILTENDIADRPYQIVQDLDVWVHKPNVFADDRMWLTAARADSCMTLPS